MLCRDAEEPERFDLMVMCAGPDDSAETGATSSVEGHDSRSGVWRGCWGLPVGVLRVCAADGGDGVEAWAGRCHPTTPGSEPRPCP